MMGKVHWFCEKKGYGFISFEHGGKEEKAFCHATAINWPGQFNALTEGQEVTFDLIQGSRGFQASGVEPKDWRAGDLNSILAAFGKMRVKTDAEAIRFIEDVLEEDFGGFKCWSDFLDRFQAHYPHFLAYWDEFHRENDRCTLCYSVT